MISTEIHCQGIVGYLVQLQHCAGDMDRNLGILRCEDVLHSSRDNACHADVFCVTDQRMGLARPCLHPYVEGQPKQLMPLNLSGMADDLA